MADITILHWNIAGGGGAESLCMHVLEALQDDHDLTLLTTQTADIDDLNEYYGTDVSADLQMEVPTLAGVEFGALTPLLDQVEGGRLGVLRPLRFTAFHLACKSSYSDSDLVFNTYSEMGSSQSSVQYVLYPQYNRAKNPFESLPDGRVHNTLDQLVTSLGGPNPKSRTNTMVTLSQWAADLLERLYDVEPSVVYPPVRTAEFASAPIEQEQEPGFLIVSRVLPAKGQLRAIEIVQGLRERGHDVHLHVVGPSTSQEYATTVRAKANDREYVTYEGKLSRPDLVRMLKRHRYGLHGMPNEHFGIVVAEMIAADTLPFVPRQGGPREIVNQQEELLYSSPAEAVQKIDQVLSNPDLEQRLRDSLPDVEERFGVGRFEQRIQSIVNERLNSS